MTVFTTDPNPSGEIPSPDDDFYEEDERVEDLQRAFELAEEKGTTGRYDSLGAEPTRDLARERARLLDERTENIGPWSEFSHPVRRPVATGEIPAYNPETIGVVDLNGPQPTPPPLPKDPRPAIPPKPSNDLGDAQPLWPLERVAGDEDTQVQTILESLTATVDGEMAPLPRPGQPIPMPTPPVPPQPNPAPDPKSTWRDSEPTVWQRITHRPKHRKPSNLTAAAYLTVTVVLVVTALWQVIG